MMDLLNNKLNFASFILCLVSMEMNKNTSYYKLYKTSQRLLMRTITSDLLSSSYTNNSAPRVRNHTTPYNIQLFMTYAMSRVLGSRQRRSIYHLHRATTHIFVGLHM